MKRIKSLIKDTVSYIQDGNKVHFIIDEDDRPYWSKMLERSFVKDETGLKMYEKYKNQKNIAARDDKLKRFFDFISERNGVKVDLASGPSGYFSPVLDTLDKSDVFIATDACPSVIAAHSEACSKENFFVFDIDLDKGLPFYDECIDVFSGKLLNNVNNYDVLIGEVYRSLKYGGRFAVIEMFFEHGCKTFEHLNSQGAVWSSFETFVKFCESTGFKHIGSDILQSRKGKIDSGDLYPLDENDCWTERTVYFVK